MLRTQGLKHINGAFLMRSSVIINFLNNFQTLEKKVCNAGLTRDSQKLYLIGLLNFQNVLNLFL